MKGIPFVVLTLIKQRKRLISRNVNHLPLWMHLGSCIVQAKSKSLNISVEWDILNCKSPCAGGVSLTNLKCRLSMKLSDLMSKCLPFIYSFISAPVSEIIY